MEEVWKPIKDFEGYYEVSNLGNVRSVDRIVEVQSKNQFGSYTTKRLCKGTILRPSTNNFGYPYVLLCKDGKYTTLYVHRLVAQAFLPNPDSLPEVNHIDEDKTNNRVTNLEWCSSKYNSNYGTRNKTISTTRGKVVSMYDMEGNKLNTFKSARSAARSLNKKTAAGITMCCKGKRKTAYGYIWKYAD